MAGEHGDGVLELRALHADGDQLRLHRLQLRLGRYHVGTRGDAGGILVLGDLQRALDIAATVSRSRRASASAARRLK